MFVFIDRRGRLALFALLVLFHTDAVRANELLLARFHNEYPAAQDKLKNDISNLSGKGKYYEYIGTDPQATRANDIGLHGEEFNYFKKGDLYRWDRSLPKDQSDFSRVYLAAHRSEVIGLNSIFIVNDPGTDNAKVALTVKNTEGRTFREMNSILKDTLQATHFFILDTVENWRRYDGMSFKDAVWVDEKQSLLKITFEYSGERMWTDPSDKPSSYQFQGEWVFDTSKNWALVDWAYRDWYSTEQNNKESWGTEVICHIDLAVRDEHVLPAGVTRIENDLKQGANLATASYDPFSILLVHFDSLDIDHATDDDFSPSALGVKNWQADPVSVANRRRTLFILLNIGIGLVILGIACYWHFVVRRRDSR